MTRFDAARPTPRPSTAQTGAASPIQSPTQAPISQDPAQVTPMPPIQPPILPGPVTPARTLGADDLKAVAGVGGAGISGVGTLKGVIDVQQMGQLLRPFLITANPGSRSEVKFLLDVDAQAAAKQKGQSLEVTGTIDKLTMYSGKITGATLGEARGISPGAYRTFSGTVEHRNIMGIGGEAPPSGPYLNLDAPIEVDGKPFDRLFLADADKFADGVALQLHGRVDVGRFGGVEVRDGTYLALSGISNVGAGEPTFTLNDGFTTAAGKSAPALILERRDLYDAPNVVMVADQGQDKVFIGTHGGMRMPGSNPFGGFTGSAPITQPTDADRAAVTFDERSGKLVNAASGEALERLSAPPAPRNGGADMMDVAWYLDRGENTAYRLANGGIAGFRNHMDQVVRLPGA